MGQSADEFMQERVAENVQFIGYPPQDGIDPEAEHLATQCVVDADAAGIAKSVLEAEFGDLPRYMNSQILRMADEEVAAKAGKSD